MPKIHFEHRHALAPEEARRRVGELLEQFGAKYHFTSRWDRPDHASVSGTGLKGSVDLRAGVAVFDLDLSLLLTPIKSKIEAGISGAVSGALV